MRPMILSSRTHTSTVSVDGGALVVDEVPAPRHLCGPVPESFVVLPRPIRLTPAPVVVGTVPEFVLRPLSLKAQRMSRCKVARYASPVPLMWNAATCNLDVDRAMVQAMRHPAINEPCGPVKLHDAQREQARLALRAIRAMLYGSKLPQ